MPHKLILASSSPYRKRQLEALGLDFSISRAKMDEEFVKAQALATSPSIQPQQLCELLAQKKAQSLVSEHPGDLIIGCDQLAHIEGQILGKPGSVDKACEQLALLSGKQHELITSVCVTNGSKTRLHTDVTFIRLRQLSKAEIQAYVKLDKPLDCAAAYKIEQAGICLIQSLETKDPSAIVGIPLIGLTDLLLSFGFSLFAERNRL